MKFARALPLLAFSFAVNAKTFQNSYVAFDLPDDWACMQEGVAWTCTPQNAIQSKEAVIVLAAKVAGPEDTVPAFLSFLKQPKKITTKVGTPMPSQVMYAQQRSLAGTSWVQAQHLGSEIQEYYTLYLATVKEQLAILVSFSAERNHYQSYNPVFDRAIKTLKITANQQLLFPKRATGGGDVFGIQGAQPPKGNLTTEEMLPPTRRKSSSLLYILVLLIAAAGGAYYFWSQRKNNSSSKKRSGRSK